MSKYVQRGITLIREHWRAYLAINIVYYGLMIACMLVVVIFPDLQHWLLQTVKQAASAPIDGVMPRVFAAYANHNFLAALAITFVVNLVIGALLSITIPSLILPFSGFLIALYRAALWGLLLSPADPQLRWIMIPHSLTLLIEGQAYVIAMLAAWQQGLALLRPSTVGATTRRQALATGLKRTTVLYVLIVILLAVAAVYEAFECIYLVPLLKPH